MSTTIYKNIAAILQKVVIRLSWICPIELISLVGIFPACENKSVCWKFTTVCGKM